MRWEDERYVRSFVRDTPDWIALSWQARSVFNELLRKVDRAGLVQLGKGSWRGLAALLRMPTEIVEVGMLGDDGLLADGCVTICDGTLLIRNFLVAQECVTSDKARKQKSRELARDRAVRHKIERDAGLPSQTVTAAPESGHETSASSAISDETSLCAVPSRAEPNGRDAASPGPRRSTEGPKPPVVPARASGSTVSITPALLYRLGEVYEEAIRSSTGNPYGLNPLGRKDIAAIATSHLPLWWAIADVLAWFEERVKSWVAACGSNAITHGGYRPNRMLDWLNAGSPSEWGARKTSGGTETTQRGAAYDEWREPDEGASNG